RSGSQAHHNALGGNKGRCGPRNRPAAATWPSLAPARFGTRQSRGETSLRRATLTKRLFGAVTPPPPPARGDRDELRTPDLREPRITGGGSALPGLRGGPRARASPRSRAQRAADRRRAGRPGARPAHPAVDALT